MTTTQQFIHISTERDAWGTDIGDFAIAAEVAKITEAAECRGIAVYTDGDGFPDEYSLGHFQKYDS